MDHAAVTRLLELSPFGRSNRRPTVRVSDVTVTEPPRQMGGQGKHLSMRLRQSDGVGLRAVWWQAGDLAETIHAGQRLDVAVEPKLNEWNGRVSVEVEVRDAIVR